MRFFLLIVFCFFAAACKTETAANRPSVSNNSVANSNKVSVSPNPAADKIPVYTYEIVNTFKHDPKAFTQGLAVHDGFLYESTGGDGGDSSLRKIELQSGKVLQKHQISDDYFAEGMTIFNGKIYQITWREKTAFVYDLNDFKLLKELSYQGEGWGLTHDGKNLIMSDGTHIIKFIDPETFQTVRTVAVLQDNGKPLFLLNELEYVKGEIWANIWHSEETATGTTQGQMPNIGKPNYIARIDPNTGKIVGWIDLDKISPADSGDDYGDTLNGIAYDEASDRIFVTGKNWRNLFEIKLKAK